MPPQEARTLPFVRSDDRLRLHIGGNALARRPNGRDAREQDPQRDSKARDPDERRELQNRRNVPGDCDPRKQNADSPAGERQDTDAEPKKERAGYEHGRESSRCERMGDRLTDELLIAERLHAGRASQEAGARDDDGKSQRRCSPSKACVGRSNRGPQIVEEPQQRQGPDGQYEHADDRQARVVVRHIEILEIGRVDISAARYRADQEEAHDIDHGADDTDPSSDTHH